MRHPVLSALARLLGRKLLALADVVEDPRASSATLPVNSPASSRKNRPCSGSRVCRVMPASSSALLLYQLVWPPRWFTATGWFGDDLVEMLAVERNVELGVVEHERADPVTRAAWRRPS